VIQEVNELLAHLPSQDRLKALRAIAALNGHRVLPGIGGFNPTNVPLERRPKAPSTPKSRKTPEQKVLQDKISAINDSIKLKSKVENRVLPSTDPLLLERAQLFRVLKTPKADAVCLHMETQL
jgi:hypothetical protein